MAKTIINQLSELGAIKDIILSKHEKDDKPTEVVQQKETSKVDPIFQNDILPGIVTLNYKKYEEAAMAAIKFIPLLHENLKGIKSVASSKKKKKLVVTTVSKHSFIFEWQPLSEFKIFHEEQRSNSFSVMMHCYEELRKLDNIQIILQEDIQQKVFIITINQVAIIKAQYNTNNVTNVKILRKIKEDIINNPTPIRPHEVQAREFAKYLMSIYNATDIPKRLNLNIGYKRQEFIPSERISVSTKKLPQPKIPTTRPRAVGTCLVITSDRNDRFDHDD